MRSAGRASASLAGIVAIVAGVPILLWQFAQPLVPSRLPSLHEAIAAFLRPDDGSLLMGTLLLVAALVWVQLCASILAELAAVLRHRPGRRVELPGLSASRLLASVLVAGILGTGSTGTALAVQPVAAIVAMDPAPGGSPVTVPHTALPHYVVQERDSLWRIAEARLGDPLRWREIYDLNSGIVQPDGGRLCDSTLLRPGWNLLLPVDAAATDTTAVVHAGDTLGEIATQRLHDPGRAGEIFTLNEGRTQPDGFRLSDPDLIRPGWRLTLPAPPSPARSTPSRNDDHPPPRPSPSPSTADHPAPTTEPAAPEPTSRAPEPTPPQPTAPQPTTEPQPSAPAGPAADPASASAAAVAELGVSALVLSGLVAALAVRRRRQQRHRGYHRRIAVPDDAAGRREWRAAAQPPALDTATLDAALRGLALHDWSNQPTPDLARVVLDPDHATLHLTDEATLPPPFHRDQDAPGWLLPGDADLPLRPDEAGRYCAPYPLLVSVAADHERTLLLDMERLGYATMTGEGTAAVGLLRHIATELTNARWAEDVEILLVGFGAELVPLNTDRLRVLPDLDAALAEVRVCTRRIAATRDATGSDVVAGRLAGVAPDGWLPVVLLVADLTEASDAARADLHELAKGPLQRGFAVLVHDTDIVGTEIHVAENGTLLTPGAEPDRWTAQTMTEAVAGGLADILAPTYKPSLPPGPATHPQPWAVGMDADGSLSAPETTPISEPGPVNPDALRRLEIVERQDPDLDSDLDTWHNDTPSRPLIGVLGEPSVRAPGERPRTRAGWFTEILVYLALHPAGVSQDKALTDLWPDGNRINVATVRSSLYGARRWAGRGLDGDPGRGFVSDLNHDQTYRLRGHLLDFDLFRRLRKRAQARHAARHPGAIHDYQAALRLVRGPVLSALRPSGYAWLNNHDQRHDLQIPGFLVDTAHELVDIALAAGDTELARWAAETARALDVDVIFDRPFTDLMRVAHAQGQTSEMERYARMLLDARELDIIEDLPPETFTVLDQLMPAGPRPARRTPP